MKNCPNCGSPIEPIKIGDLVEYLALGGWYVRGIVLAIDKDSSLIEVTESDHLWNGKIPVIHIRVFNQELRIINKEVANAE